MKREHDDILDLFKKLNESSTPDIDESKGDYVVGDVVKYNMLGEGILNLNDLHKTIGAARVADRTFHESMPATIIEAEDGPVSRYSIEFDDGFVINGVTINEIAGRWHTLDKIDDKSKGCLKCGKDTENDTELCRNCTQHGERHTEDKDRKMLPHEMSFDPDMDESAIVESKLQFEDTEIHTDFERDNAKVELRNTHRSMESDSTIVEWNDEEVYEAVEDGFLDPKDWHGSAYKYADEHGLLPGKHPNESKEVKEGWTPDWYKKNIKEAKTELTVPQKHQFSIAKRTLGLSDEGAKILGGMTKAEARAFLSKIGWSKTKIAKLEESIMVEAKNPAKKKKAKKAKKKKEDNTSDLKAKEVPQTEVPNEEPNIDAEDHGMEDRSQDDLEKENKTKAPKEKTMIRDVKKDELANQPDHSAKESIEEEVVDADTSTDKKKVDLAKIRAEVADSLNDAILKMVEDGVLKTSMLVGVDTPDERLRAIALGLTNIDNYLTGKPMVKPSASLADPVEPEEPEEPIDPDRMDPSQDEESIIPEEEEDRPFESVEESDDAEDQFTVIGRGFVDRAEADDLAKDKDGMVITDDKQKEKWMVITKEKKAF